jgi:hypothetical protein
MQVRALGQRPTEKYKHIRQLPCSYSTKVGKSALFALKTFF